MLPARPQFRLTSQCAQLCQDGGTAPSRRTSRQILLLFKNVSGNVTNYPGNCVLWSTVCKETLCCDQAPHPQIPEAAARSGYMEGRGRVGGGAEPGEEGHMPHSAGRGARQNWMQPSTPGASVCPGPAVGLVSPHQLPHPCGHTQDNLRHPGMPCPYLSWAGG